MDRENRMKISELELLRHENELLHARVKTLEYQLSKAVEVHNLLYVAQQRNRTENEHLLTDFKPKKKRAFFGAPT